MQPPDSKAPTQEKLHTTTFMECAGHGTQPDGYYATQPGQPIVIRTRQLTDPAHSHAAPAGSGDQGVNGADTGSPPLGTTGDTEGTYPGLEVYELMLGENTTTTALFTAAPAATQHSTDAARNPRPNGDVEASSVAEVASHRPPTRNVGSTDEKDIIACSLRAGASPKDLVDSIRRELSSMSGHLSGAGETTRGQSSTTNTTNGAARPVKKPRKSSYLDS